MMNPKHSLFLFTVFAAVAVTLSSCGSRSQSETQYLPAQLTDGGAWGFIDAKGERIGARTWEHEPTVTRDGIFTARTDNGLTVYRWHGDKAEPIDSLQDLASVGEVNEGLVIVAPFMKRMRVVDTDGDLRFELGPVDGKEITSTSSAFHDGLLTFTTEDSRSGVIDRNGKVIVGPRYSIISDYSNGYALAVIYPENEAESEKGPRYFVLDKEGKETPVEGRFGYPEGECIDVPSFENGRVILEGPYDPDNNDGPAAMEVTTDGKSKRLRDWSWSSALSNGARVVNTTDKDGKSISTWSDPQGKELLKKTDVSLQAMGDYVLETKYDSDYTNATFTVYDSQARQIGTLKGQFTIESPGDGFGFIVTRQGKEFDIESAMLYDKEFKPVKDSKYSRIGSSKMIGNSDDTDEIDCGFKTVTSAYVDIPAAATKFVSMIKDGAVRGKEIYYLGASISDMLKGENARFFSGSDRTIYIPTAENSSDLGHGAGFWISGQAESSASVVAPTYQKYFDVAYVDYYGTKWGHWRQKQTGVKFNPSAKVAAFDLQMRTNYPSGKVLRDNITRRLKSAGYVQTASTETYDEYQKDLGSVIIYGTDETCGIGAYIKSASDISKMSGTKKSALAASL